LILSNFSFDLISEFLIKKPVASGLIYDFSSDGDRHKAILEVVDGKVHEGEFIRSNKFVGSITKIDRQVNLSPDKISVEIEGNAEFLAPKSIFKVYSNLRAVNILLLVELTFIFSIFYFILRSIKPWKILTIAALGFSIVLWVYRNIFLDKIHSYGGFYNGFTTILIILFALTFFYYQLKRPENPFIYSSPTFWIVSAILLYKAGTFFLFLYTNTLDQKEKANFYTINSGFYILQNLLFAIAFITHDKMSVKKHSKRLYKNSTDVAAV
jgi:hypothetical protein